MYKDRIWTLMSRKLSGEATSAELSELDELQKMHPDVGLPSQFVQEFWNMPAETEEEFLEATFHLHTEILQKKGFHLNSNHTETGSFTLEDHQNIPKKKRLLFAAVTCVLLVSLVLIGIYNNKESNTSVANKIAKSEVSTKKGSRTKVQLPDGTTVWLNSSSKLTYDNQNFGKLIREVSLSGEAYFDVVKNKAKPFIIHTAKMDIKVLGTVFNVKCYPGEKTTETSLIHGSVEVTLNDRQEKIMLKPNEKLIFNTLQNQSKKIDAVTNHLKISEKEKPIIELSHLTIYPLDNSIVETGWKENKLVFRNESLDEIALKMERWYGVSILISNEDLKNELITGSFEKETIYQALK
ncbi:MAG: FecR family protein, partial [Ferruginibacter sp.]|nr:FecR family protein [Ferruginibacter sp.]